MLGNIKNQTPTQFYQDIFVCMVVGAFFVAFLLNESSRLAPQMSQKLRNGFNSF